MAIENDTEKNPGHAVEQTERDAHSSPAPEQHVRTTRDKLGVYNIVVLILGTAIIVLAVSFLAFIWHVSINQTQNGPLPPLWKLIVKRTWVSRTITLGAILIRVATAAQLCVFAAIMAALILERVGASARDFPLLSMIRCANTGPQALIWNVLHTLKTGTQIGYSILIVVTILNALALQFTSTILITDLFSVSVLVDSDVRDDIYFGLSYLNANDTSSQTRPQVYSGIDFWKTGPQLYQRFAEYKENSSRSANFTDTGKTYRGFLPYVPAQNRTQLRKYDGPMEVIDARVVCVRPALSNLSVTKLNRTGYGSNDWVMTGTVDFNGVYPSMISTKPSNGSDSWELATVFNCSVPYITTTPGYAGNLSMCLWNGFGAKLLDGILPENEDTGGATRATIIINATHVSAYEDDLPQNITKLHTMDPTLDSWAKFGNDNVTFDLSVCFFNPQPTPYQVSASASYDATDGEAHYYNDTSGTYYDTYFIQFMYGIYENYTQEDRGLLTMKNPANWSAMSIETMYNKTTESFVFDSISNYYDDDYLAPSYQLSIDANVGDAMHRKHSALFSQILNGTGNLALAFQTHFTVLIQMAYYDFFEEYDVQAPADQGFSQPIIIPLQWYGFIAIISLLGLHFVLIVTAVVLFITRTKLSLLGNAWQAVSQVMSTDTAATVHQGAMATDQEVIHSAKNANTAERTVLIVRPAVSGRTEATSVARRR